MAKAEIKKELRDFLGHYCDIVFWDREKKSEIKYYNSLVIAIEDEFLLIKTSRRLVKGEELVIGASANIEDLNTIPAYDELVWAIERVFINSLRSIVYSTIARND